jgi:hypothetical protein
MGSITEISEGAQTYQVTPVGGTTSNTESQTFTYNGVNYRLYRFLTAGPGTSFNVQVKTCQ